MKRKKTWAALIACSLVVNAATAAANSESNPYSHIASRNAFNLQPEATPQPVQPNVTVPQIILQGITSILGRWQVLFRIPPGQAGAAGQSYILQEGEGQDGIEVLTVDQAGWVRFNNHGILQWLNLEQAPRPQIPTTPSNTLSRTQQRPPTAPDPSALTAEEQTILMEVEREVNKDLIQRGDSPPPPPTGLLPEEPQGMPARAPGHE
jgi:hypothetical protein